MGRLQYDFSREYVLVTGASRGIGRAVAEGFAAVGADVPILSSGSSIHDTAKEMSERFGRKVTAIECDITDSAAVQAALAPLGRIDVLVNNAGLERITPLLDPDPAVEDTFRRITDINSAEWRARELAIPLARFGQPDEIGELAPFLAGPGGPNFTGQGAGSNCGSIMP